MITRADFDAVRRCGHDSITAAIIQACCELKIEPHRVAKLSGIGCSSKTPDHFLGNSHGFNTVHGRMPSVLTGANLANHDLIYLGVSGDGDSASIGVGQFAHCDPARRQHGLYRRKQRRVRPHQGSVLGDGGQGLEVEERIDQYRLRSISWRWRFTRRSFVARSFSGDKTQLVPLIKAAIEHKGAAFIDVISPCVAFNNHSGSTKSFDYVREHNVAVNRLDFMTGREPITVDYAPGTVALSSSTTAQNRVAQNRADYEPHDRIGRDDVPAASFRRGPDHYRTALRRRRFGRSTQPPQHDRDAA